MNTHPLEAFAWCCPWCNALRIGDDEAKTCLQCGGILPRQDHHSVGHYVRKRLVWLVKAYRVWSLGVFTVAVFHLILAGQFGNYFAAFLVIFPFTTALALSYRLGDRTPGWIVTFLILVDLGVIIGPEHQILPKLNLFPQIPLTQNRILSWCFLVYATLQYVVMPPIAFFRSLRTAWYGGRPALSPWICLFGFAVWGFVAMIFTMLLINVCV